MHLSAVAKFSDAYYETAFYKQTCLSLNAFITDVFLLHTRLIRSFSQWKNVHFQLEIGDSSQNSTTPN